MKKFVCPEIKIADLRSEETMAGILRTSYEGTPAKNIINISDAAEGYDYWKSWNAEGWS